MSPHLAENMAAVDHVDAIDATASEIIAVSAALGTALKHVDVAAVDEETLDGFGVLAGWIKDKVAAVKEHADSLYRIHASDARGRVTGGSQCQ
jgi:hypothetical protein